MKVGFQSDLNFRNRVVYTGDKLAKRILISSYSARKPDSVLENKKQMFQQLLAVFFRYK